MGKKAFRRSPGLLVACEWSAFWSSGGFFVVPWWSAVCRGRLGRSDRVVVLVVVGFMVVMVVVALSFAVWWSTLEVFFF